MSEKLLQDHNMMKLHSKEEAQESANLPEYTARTQKLTWEKNRTSAQIIYL